jgi:hypothetical protein
MPVSLVTGIPCLCLCRRDVRAPQPNEVAALVGMASHLRTWPTAHALLKLPDRRLPGTPQYCEIDRAVRVAASAFDLKVTEASVERVPHRRGGLCGPAIALHAVIPRLAGCDVGPEPRLPGALVGLPDRLAPTRSLEGPPMGPRLRLADRPRQAAAGWASRSRSPQRKMPPTEATLILKGAAGWAGAGPGDVSPGLVCKPSLGLCFSMPLNVAFWLIHRPALP